MALTQLATKDISGIPQSPSGPSRPRERGSNGRSPRKVNPWLRAVSPLALLLIWQLACSLGVVSSEKLPSPTTLIHTTWGLITTSSPAYGTLQGALLVSLERVLIGFSVGAAVALILALASGMSSFGEVLIDPLMQMIRTLPLFGLVPVFIVWFGIGQLPKVVLIALGAAIPLYLNAFAGVRSVDSHLAELAKVLRLTRRETLRHVIIPGALPQTLVGLRQSLGTAWLSLVVAEQLNTKAGLGFMINQAEQFLQNNVIFVVLIVYTVLGLTTDWMVRLVERRALRWRVDVLG